MLVRYRYWIATGANRFIGIITIKSFDVTNDNHNNVFLLSEFHVLIYKIIIVVTLIRHNIWYF